MTDLTDPVERGGWHLDKRIPIILIATIGIGVLGQSAAAIWWASAINNRVGVIENTVATINSYGERLTRVETKVDGLKDTLDKVERAVNTLSRTRDK